MEMGSKKSIGSIEPQNEVYTCPSCGYEDGFHVSFKFKGRKTGGEIYLICPIATAVFESAGLRKSRERSEHPFPRETIRPPWSF